MTYEKDMIHFETFVNLIQMKVMKVMEKIRNDLIQEF
jgi:hypothetical protein